MAEGAADVGEARSRRGYVWAWAATLAALAGRVALDPLIGGLENSCRGIEGLRRFWGV